MKVSIGKNTLGGGKKMTTELNNYNRSTHDLSFVFRSSMAPGVLVPSAKFLVLPGDTFDINTRCHTLTHPTIGPLFGSFKQQNDFFFCPIRLYQAMLHNNALNIGMNMGKVKFPKIVVSRKNWNKSASMLGSNNTLRDEVNPSSLPAYLGIKDITSYDNGNKTSVSEINAIPTLGYFDTFKQYYANKQEDNFYTIAGSNSIPYASTVDDYPTFYLANLRKDQAGDWYIGKLEQEVIGGSYEITIPSASGQEESNLGICFTGDTFDVNDTYVELDMYYLEAYKGIYSVQELINEGILQEVELGKNLPSITTHAYIFTQISGKDSGDGITVTIRKSPKAFAEASLYNSYPLTDIDEMREDILAKGKGVYYADKTFITDIFKSTVSPNQGYNRPACANPMAGLCLKTYQSDINVNWVKTEWLDGDNGINAITAIDTSSGSFTIDQLNLATKVYTMLNRIAVSDGSYNAWIQTVYTSGGLNHIETPLYLGGSSLEIEFQEVLNNSGSEEEPLGTIAGRGVATNHKGGNIRFKADEPGYILCITSITPRVDYYQGNDFDTYMDDMDDLHKPQLDGIGFQDRLYRNVNSNITIEANLKKSIGKQPAWIEYMTNVNKTFGNFALIENEGWMCLNRIFGELDTYTTYVQPHLYNNIFADTDLSAQNFWIQIAFNVQARRVMSAKQIPNL